jgi:hypothetical protein
MDSLVIFTSWCPCQLIRPIKNRQRFRISQFHLNYGVGGGVINAVLLTPGAIYFISHAAEERRAAATPNQHSPMHALGGRWG